MPRMVLISACIILSMHVLLLILVILFSTFCVHVIHRYLGCGGTLTYVYGLHAHFAHLLHSLRVRLHPQPHAFWCYLAADFRLGTQLALYCLGSVFYIYLYTLAAGACLWHLACVSTVVDDTCVIE